MCLRFVGVCAYVCTFNTAGLLIQVILSSSFERTMDPSKAHYTLSHGQIAHVDKSERDINVTVATSRVPSEMTVQGQRCAKVAFSYVKLYRIKHFKACIDMCLCVA